MRSVSSTRPKDRALKALDAQRPLASARPVSSSAATAASKKCRSAAFIPSPIPGAVHGWATLLESHGTKTLSDVLQAAIRHAEEGFPVAELTAEQWKESEARLKADEGAAVNYLIDGRTPKAGEIFKNPRMAATLKRIADRTAPTFSTKARSPRRSCAVRKKWADFSRSRTLPIIARIGSSRSPPNYRGYDIYEMPPATQGFVALEMLKILEGFDLKSAGAQSADALHLMIEAKKLAFLDRDLHLADRDFMKVSGSDLLSSERMESSGANRARNAAQRVSASRDRDGYGIRRRCRQRRQSGFVYSEQLHGFRFRRRRAGDRNYSTEPRSSFFAR